MAAIALDHGIWVDIEGPGVIDGWRPRSVIRSLSHPGMFEVDGKLYCPDGTPVDVRSPKINYVFEQVQVPKTHGGSGHERINPRHLFRQ